MSSVCVLCVDESQRGLRCSYNLFATSFQSTDDYSEGRNNGSAALPYCTLGQSAVDYGPKCTMVRFNLVRQVYTVAAASRVPQDFNYVFFFLIFFRLRLAVLDGLIFKELKVHFFKKKNLRLDFKIRKCIFLFFTEQINQRSLGRPGSWCVKRTEESTSRVNSSVPLTHHDPRDLGLICLTTKTTVFGFLQIYESNLRFS